MNGMSDTIHVYNPATGDDLRLIQDSTPADVDAAVQRAHAVEKAWAGYAASVRVVIFVRAAVLIRERLTQADGFAQRRTGKVVP